MNATRGPDIERAVQRREQECIALATAVMEPLLQQKKAELTRMETVGSSADGPFALLRDIVRGLRERKSLLSLILWSPALVLLAGLSVLLAPLAYFEDRRTTRRTIERLRYEIEHWGPASPSGPRNLSNLWRTCAPEFSPPAIRREDRATLLCRWVEVLYGMPAGATAARIEAVRAEQAEARRRTGALISFVEPVDVVVEELSNELPSYDSVDSAH